MSESAPQTLSKERVSDETLVSEVPIIVEGGVTALTRENLSRLVEAPLLEACEDLYDKNIETVMSSANVANVGGEGYIAVSFDSLSDQNKEVALQFGQPYKMHGSNGVQCINITFPITSETTVGNIRKMASEAVSKFHNQEMTWAKRDTLEGLAKIYGVSASDLSPETFPDKYYDPETGYLYDSEEHYRKVKGL